MTGEPDREGSLEAPTRHPLKWREAAFYDEKGLFDELERVFDICHGCRRCFNLCNSFPTLFDLVDESHTTELDGVAKTDYWKVVDHCYLCDMCFMTKCPYVPPHEWNVDFPHLMLRAKAVKHAKGEHTVRDKVLSLTDAVGGLVAKPVLAPIANAANRLKPTRAALETVFGVHSGATLPDYQSKPFRKRKLTSKRSIEASPCDGTQGKVILFSTCYGNFNEPRLCEDLIAVYEHNDIPVKLAKSEQCCGMPKLELGNLEAVAKAKEHNISLLSDWVDEGYDIVAPIPSCVLMLKQELPLMFPDDEQVMKVRDAIFDPFEYLMLRHKGAKLRTDFKRGLGKVSYHVACHQRVQNIGLKTKELFELIPGTQVLPIERCSGHDGTYAVKVEFHETAMKIAKPVAKRVMDADADYFVSDCVMAGRHIANAMAGDEPADLPFSLIRLAYGI